MCCHYEGIDERFIEECVDEEISLGDFVMTGGEIPAMAVADAVCRLVPGVLSDPSCYENESHWNGMLEAPRIPGRKSGMTGRCPQSCCPGTTPTWRSGGGSRASCGPTAAGQISMGGWTCPPSRTGGC